MKYRIQNKKLIIYSLLTVLWIALIFSFSLQPADTSSEISTGFGEWLVGTFIPAWQDELEAMPLAQWEFWHHILRKCAHFTEYFVLGVLMILTFLQTGLRLRWVKSISAGALAACVDETIQLFVEGRSGQVTDVLLDSAGVAVGVAAVILARHLYKKLNGAIM